MPLEHMRESWYFHITYVSGAYRIPIWQFMLRGLGAIRTFCMGVSAIINKVVAPVSAIPCELGINGSVVCTLCAHTLLCDTFEVTTVFLSSSEVLIWVGYKTGSSINEFKHLNPNCSAPHRHMGGSWDLCIAFVHAISCRNILPRVWACCASPGGWACFGRMSILSIKPTQETNVPVCISFNYIGIHQHHITWRILLCEQRNTASKPPPSNEG